MGSKGEEVIKDTLNSEEECGTPILENLGQKAPTPNRHTTPAQLTKDTPNYLKKNLGQPTEIQWSLMEAANQGTHKTTRVRVTET